MTLSQAIMFSRTRFGLGPITQTPPILSGQAMVNDRLKAFTVTAWGQSDWSGLVKAVKGWSAVMKKLVPSLVVKVFAVAIGSAPSGDGDGSDKLSKYGHTAREPSSTRGYYWPWPGGPSWPTPYLV